MGNINDFYNSILNIRDYDYSQLIEKITIEQRDKILQRVSELTGLCKYIADQIDIELKKAGLKTYLIDLNSIGVDHVFLIAEYKYKNVIRRVLIDPTYIQFVKTDNRKLIGFHKWPGDILNTDILKDLVQKGMTFIDNERFQNYLNSFGYKATMSLDDFLISYKIWNKEF